MAATEIQIDTAAIERSLGAFADSLLTGFRPQLNEVARLESRSIDKNFDDRGRPDIWAMLAPATITARERRAKKTGKQAVAGMDTPLRVDDTLRKAATAVSPGTTGSTVKANDWAWSNELTLPYAAIQQEGGTIDINNLFGRGIHAQITIPARPYLFFQEDEAEDYVDLFFFEVNRRIEAAGLEIL